MLYWKKDWANIKCIYTKNINDPEVNSSQFIDEKISIMKEYKNEIKEPPFPRSVEAVRGLAGYRGAGIGTAYAEVFRALKIIEK